MSTIRRIAGYTVRIHSLFARLYATVIYIYCKYAINHSSNYGLVDILCSTLIRVGNIDNYGIIIKLIQKIINKNCYFNGKILPIQKNKLLTSFYCSAKFNESMKFFQHEPENERLRVRHYRDDGDITRQGNLIVVKKWHPGTGEKGALILKYTPTFEHFATIYNIANLTREYRLVFEPSWNRNVEASLFLYAGAGLRHVFQGSCPDDKTLLGKFDSFLDVIDLGSSDWIDPAVFTPDTKKKVYDVVMVASWSRLKRHDILFSALKTLKRNKRSFRIALIGYPMDRQKNDITKLARKYGVDSLCDFYERIAPVEVAQIVASSKVAVHLSKHEGTNKASYEAWLCDVPVIVYKYNSGFRKNYINSNTGLLSDDKDLADSIAYVWDNPDIFSPRSWLLQHSGYLNATKKLNESLKSIALSNGEAWTTDIVPKKNAPNFRYANEADRLYIDSEYLNLKKHLLKNNTF